ncbi:hypothetical protein ACFLW6_01860 [Chloroflexota bacterium]
MKQNMHLLRLFSLAIIFVLFALLLQSCEEGGFLTIENLHNKEVSIFISPVRKDRSIDESTKPIVDISANATKTFAIVLIDRNRVYRIEAIDTSGRVVFSHDYKMGDLEDIDWKIVIPPS